MTNADPNDSINRPNRGRIQAQGGGTEKSESWAQAEPPTVMEMLKRCTLLEGKLTDTERRDRKELLEDLRAFIKRAGASGGIDAFVSKSFVKWGSGDIRIDLEIHKGRACVPDKEKQH
jgi:hypothetical protein